MPRSNKVLDDELHHYAVPSFWHPWNQQQQSQTDSQATPPKQGQQQAGQLAPIPVTNPTNRASQCGEEEEEEGKQSPSSTKKGRAPFIRDAPSSLP